MLLTIGTWLSAHSGVGKQSELKLCKATGAEELTIAVAVYGTAQLVTVACDVLLFNKLLYKEPVKLS